MKLSVVIPAHNEEEIIEKTVLSVRETLIAKEIPYEIVVVNDRSSDDTGRIIDELHSRDPNIVPIHRNEPPNGFGLAVTEGVVSMSGDAVVIFMADASDRVEDIVAYHEKLQEGYDCVFGSRFIKGSKVTGYPWLKYVINRMANFFIRVLFQIKLNDTTNAFKAYRREVIEGISPLFSYHFNLTVEMPLKAIVRGYSYTIIPIHWYGRETGVAKFKIKEMGSRYLFIILYVLLERLLSRGDYKQKVARSTREKAEVKT